MKKFYGVLLVAIVALGFSLYQVYNAIQLEKRVKQMGVMQMAQEAGADFRPFTAMTGGGTGAVDKPTNTEDGDVGILAMENDATYGNLFAPYVLDEDGAVGDDLPESILSADTGEDWEWMTGGFQALLFRHPDENDPDSMSGAAGSNGATTLLGTLVMDEDGANETGDIVFRLGDGTNQVMAFRKLHCIHATIVAPNDMDDAERDLLPIWSNETGMIFNITKIEAWSETDSMEVTLKEAAQEDFTSLSTIDVVNTGTTGTSVSHVAITAGFDDSAVAANNLIICDFDDTDEPGFFKITICGWFNADVD